MVKKYLAYQQYTKITTLHLKLKQSVNSLIHISQILVNNNQLPTRFTTNTEYLLKSIDFSVEQVSSIIKKLDGMLKL